MSRLIQTKFEDSVCRRCGRTLEKGETCNYAKPIGVWCLVPCKEFEPLEGDQALALAVLEKLEREERLKPFTLGILERYRVTGQIAMTHVECLLPQDREWREAKRAELMGANATEVLDADHR